MKCASVVKAAAAVAVVAGMVGCTDLKPIQAQIDDLKSQVGKLSGDVSGAKSSADAANSAAQSASQAASGAQSTANQALAAAHASQSCCDATNEKIDRMFKRSVSK
ncbi:MAG TPA: alanine-zipper protein [Steroidobacteraceae bacterium]|jgi:murein lipoprotein|nr:alanine-zipper protein [Steroidobacteraceae bacterium]